MSYNLRIVLRTSTITLTLYPFTPDGPLRFTVVRKFTKNDSCSWEENGLTWSGGNLLRYTITPTVPNGDGAYQYFLILDFLVTHHMGQEETIQFTCDSINYIVYGENAVTATLLGGYGMFYGFRTKGDLSSNSYWSLRKALPYPILE